MENASTSDSPGWHTWKPVAGEVVEIPRWRGPEEAAHAWNAEVWETTSAVEGTLLLSTQTRLWCGFRGAVSEARILIDPVGDLLSFYEFRVDKHGRGQSALWRESRSGHLVDARWAANATYTPESHGLVITLPFADIPPATGQVGETWRVALQSATDAGSARPSVREADFFPVRL